MLSIFLCSCLRLQFFADLSLVHIVLSTSGGHYSKPAAISFGTSGGAASDQ